MGIRKRKPVAEILTAIKSGPIPRIRDWWLLGTEGKGTKKLSPAEKIMMFIEAHIPVPEGPLVGNMMVLEPFQQAFIYAVFDNPSGTDLAILSLARKNGKQLCLTTPIPTPYGWSTMGSIRVGDTIYGANGRPTSVIAKSPIDLNPISYRMNFDCGAAVDCCADHQWQVSLPGKSRKWQVLTTAKLIAELDIAKRNGQGIRMPLCKPVEYQAKVLPIDPYLLGYWLGNGRSCGANIYFHRQDEQALRKNIEPIIGRPLVITSSGSDKGVKANISCFYGDFVSKLRDLGIYNNKHIPAIYLLGSVSQRWDLLQGLMDSDGSCDIGNGIPRCIYTASVARHELAFGVLQLLSSLGIKATKKTRKTLCQSGTFLSYYISFSAYADQKIFRIARKQERLLSRPKTNNRSQYRYIKSIEPIDPVPMQCISVSAPDELYLFGYHYGVTHNTALMGAIILAFVCGPMAEQNAQIVSGAMSRDQAAMVFDLMAKMIMLSERLSNAVRVIPSKKELIGLNNNVHYKALSADGKKNVGRSPLFALLDETGQVKGARNEFVESITTAQGAHENPLLMVISTQAPSDADLLSLWIDDAILSGDPHTVTHLYCAKEHTKGAGVDLLDEKQWRAANPALGAFRYRKDLSKQLIKADRIPSAAPGAMNLLLNMRVALESLYISPGVWKENNGEPDLSLFSDGRKVALGLDLSARHDLTAAVIAASDDDGQVHVVPYVFCPVTGIEDRASRDRAPYDTWVRTGKLIPIGGSSMDYDQIFGYLREELDKLDIVVEIICFDRWRIDIAKKACDDCGAFPNSDWVPIGQGFRDQSPSLENLTNLLLEGKVRHGGHPLLNMAASNAIAVYDPTGAVKVDKSRSTQRIDPLIAMHQAVFAVSEGDIEQAMDIQAMIG